MTTDTYKLWVDWRLGLIVRELTKEEKNDIRASEFAMHLLVPTSTANSIINKYGKKILENRTLINMIAESLGVPQELIIFKLHDIQMESEPNYEIKLEKTKNHKTKHFI